MSRQPTFVTGGTGLIGAALVRALVARGEDVVALCRATSDRSALAGLPVRWVEGRLTDADGLARAMEGAANVFHVAGLIAYRRRDRARLRETNVEGTRAMVEAALRVGARRFVHTSSVVAVGTARAGGPIDESHPWEAGDLDIGYFETKRAAEEEIARGVGRGLDAVVVNPSVVVGTGGARGNASAIVRAVARRRLRIVPPGGVNVVSLGDVVEGHLLALERGRRGERYLLGAENLTYAQFFEKIARVAGVPPPRRRLPRAAVGPLVGVLRLLDRAGLVPARARPEALGVLGEYLYFDSTKARRELGWSPAPIETAIRTVLAPPGQTSSGLIVSCSASLDQ